MGPRGPRKTKNAMTFICSLVKAPQTRGKGLLVKKVGRDATSPGSPSGENGFLGEGQGIRKKFPVKAYLLPPH